MQELIRHGLFSIVSFPNEGYAGYGQIVEPAPPWDTAFPDVPGYGDICGFRERYGSGYGTGQTALPRFLTSLDRVAFTGPSLAFTANLAKKKTTIIQLFIAHKGSPRF